VTRYAITHTTTYAYTEPVSLCQNVAHLVPRPCARQRVDSGVLSIVPEPAVIEERVDYFGNPVHYFAVQEPHRELVVTAAHGVTVAPVPARDPGATPPWESVRDRLPRDRGPEWLDAYQYVFDSRFAAADPVYAAFAGPSFAGGRPVLEAALDLTHRIHTGFAYDPKATTVSTPIAEVFESRRGVCQDFAHLLLACLRSLGLSARYVSGFLATVAPPGRPRLVGADASHAWVSLFWGARDGSTWIRPTTCSRGTGTSSSPGGATTRT
jgi:transglutaminase-like putative cysteine protease